MENNRRALQNAGLFPKRSYTVMPSAPVTVLDIKFLSAEAGEEKRKWLQTHREPWLTVENTWIETHNYRRSLIMNEDSTTKYILQQWHPYTQKNNDRLVSF